MEAAQPPVAPGRPGRPAAATREAALALARARFLAGERIDVQAIARELGLARATMHRWFRTREPLLGELLAELGEERLAVLRAPIGGTARSRCSTPSTPSTASSPPPRGCAPCSSPSRSSGLRVLTSGSGSCSRAWSRPCSR